VLPALYDSERRVLARFAAMLVLGACAVLPLTGQSTMIAGAAGTQSPLGPRTRLALPSQMAFPDYSIARDPFVPDRRFQADVSVVLPPNAGAMANAPIVRAVVVGDAARALVEINGAVRVVAVGDKIGYLTVVQITSSSVFLSDGSRLPLDRQQR